MKTLTRKQIKKETRVKRLYGNSFSFNFDFDGRKFEATPNLPGAMEFNSKGFGTFCGLGDTKKEFVNSVYETINKN